jgi:hypothetical protein
VNREQLTALLDYVDAKFDAFAARASSDGGLLESVNVPKLRDDLLDLFPKPPPPPVKPLTEEEARDKADGILAPIIRLKQQDPFLTRKALLQAVKKEFTEAKLPELHSDQVAKYLREFLRDEFAR